MLNTIEKLREKPEAHRRRIAFVVSASIAGIIFVVWLSVVGVRFNSQENIISEKEGPSLVAGVKEGFSEVFESGREQFDDSRRELESIFQQ
jgi:hypothetical protein